MTPRPPPSLATSVMVLWSAFDMALRSSRLNALTACPPLVLGRHRWHRRHDSHARQEPNEKSRCSVRFARRLARRAVCRRRRCRRWGDHGSSPACPPSFLPLNAAADGLPSCSAISDTSTTPARREHAQRSARLRVGRGWGPRGFWGPRGLMLWPICPVTDSDLAPRRGLRARAGGGQWRRRQE